MFDKNRSKIKIINAGIAVLLIDRSLEDMP